MNSNKRKGTRGEHKARQILEDAGYLVTRSGGSLGAFDLIGIGATDVRLVQVKVGRSPYLSGVEREAIQLFQVPANCSKEFWSWRPYQRHPKIERIR